jgi:transcriptional regulator of arginine metabolism
MVHQVKADRRKELMRILRGKNASSQGDIVRALRRAGHDASQATVSRDLRELGAVKVSGSGAGAAYQLSDEIPHSSGDLTARNLARTLDEFALELSVAASLVVIRTAPGHAAAVARAIDLARPKDIVGTVAGDDTIFVATRSRAVASSVARRWVGDTVKAKDGQRMRVES